MKKIRASAACLMMMALSISAGGKESHVTPDFFTQYSKDQSIMVEYIIEMRNTVTILVFIYSANLFVHGLEFSRKLYQIYSARAALESPKRKLNGRKSNNSKRTDAGTANSASGGSSTSSEQIGVSAQCDEKKG